MVICLLRSLASPAQGGIATTYHSVLNDFTGLAIAAFIAWKLTVTMQLIMPLYLQQ